jgi:hypothetical protein
VIKERLEILLVGGRTMISEDKLFILNVKFIGKGAFVTLRGAFLDAEMIP